MCPCHARRDCGVAHKNAATVSWTVGLSVHLATETFGMGMTSIDTLHRCLPVTDIGSSHTVMFCHWSSNHKAHKLLNRLGESSRLCRNAHVDTVGRTSGHFSPVSEILTRVLFTIPF